RRVVEQNRLVSARELAAAAVNNASTYPELSTLLALQAVMTNYTVDKTWTVEAEEALHRAMSVAQARLVLHGHSAGVYDVIFSPDGKRLATASLDGTAKVWDAASGKEVLTLHQAAQAGDSASDVRSVAFSPDGRRLATSGRDGAVVVWDSINGA